jgi:hypothetical protein
MNKVRLSFLAVLFTMPRAITWAESPAPPVVAFDILKADIIFIQMVWRTSGAC